MPGRRGPRRATAAQPAQFRYEAAASRVALWTRELAMTPSARGRIARVSPTVETPSHAARLIFDARQG